MTRPFHLMLALPLALTLSGCITTPEKPSGVTTPTATKSKTDPAVTSQETTGGWPLGNNPSPDREQHADDELLVYAMRFGNLTLDQQKKELTQVLQALNRNKKDAFIRLKAALIYSLPNSRLHDNAKAIPLLSDLQREKSLGEDVVALVDLLRDLVEERQRADENAARLNQRVRDEQHRADELQAKLDALKNIEKTLIDRNQGTNK